MKCNTAKEQQGSWLSGLLGYYFNFHSLAVGYPESAIGDSKIDHKSHLNGKRLQYFCA